MMVDTDLGPIDKDTFKVQHLFSSTINMSICNVNITQKNNLI